MITWLKRDQRNNAKSFFLKDNYMELQKDKRKLKYKNDDKSMSVKTDIMANKFSSTNIKKH